MNQAVFALERVVPAVKQTVLDLDHLVSAVNCLVLIENLEVSVLDQLDLIAVAEDLVSAEDLLASALLYQAVSKADPAASVLDQVV